MRIATYGLALVVVLIAALEVGYRLRPVVGPAVAESTTSTPTEHTEGSDDPDHGDGGQPDSGQPDDDHADAGGEHAGSGTPHLPEGLAASVDGYTLSLLTPRPVAGPKTEIRLLITGPDGAPVTAYDTAHGKQLHLIVVRRDLASFQHVHPVLDTTTGVWTTTIDTSAAGTYRAFADVVPHGHDGLTLGTDLDVAGDFDPEPPATTQVRVAEVDGYRVELTGDVHAGQLGTLTATVTKNGEPVADLDPYLEAYGHLVALRQSDLAYLHVHPDGHPGDGTTPAGPAVVFAVDVPTAGTYRLFLDFSHGGVVRTAPFVVTAER